MASKRVLKVPSRGLPLVRLLFDLINQENVALSTVSKRSGVSVSTISDWRWRRSPSVTNLEAVLNVMGYELSIRRKGAENDLRPL